jgi:hypothetical protein
LINLVINLFSRTQFPVGSTSHLQNSLLQTIRALASIFKIHINYNKGYRTLETYHSKDHTK